MPIPALSPSRLVAALLVLVLVTAGAGAIAGATHAALTGDSRNPANRITAAPDFRSPTISRAVVLADSGGTAGTIVAGQAYRVYAQVADRGNPPSGVASVTADVSTITSGSASVALAEGSWTVAGQTYNRRSDSLTANSNLPDASTTYSVSAKDALDQAASESQGATTAADTAPRFLGATTASTGMAQFGESLTLQRPPSVAGGLLIAAFTRINNDVLVYPPNGWSSGELIIDGDLRTRVFYRLAGASEPSSYEFVADAPTRMAAGLASFTAVAGRQSSSALQLSGTPVATHSSAGLTTTGVRRKVSLFSTRANTSSVSWSGPGIPLFSVSTSFGGGPDVSIAMFDEGPISAGSHISSATASAPSTDAAVTLYGLR